MTRNFHHLFHEKTSHANKQGRPEWHLETLAAKMSELGYTVAKSTLESWRRCDGSAPNPPVEAIATMYLATLDSDILNHICNIAGVIWHRPPEIDLADPNLMRAIAESGKEQSEMILEILDAHQDGKITEPEYHRITTECDEVIRAAWLLKHLTRHAFKQHLAGEPSAPDDA